MDKQFSYQFYSSTNRAWEAMYQEVLGAIKTIYWEVYTFVDDETGNQFVDLLCEKAKQGVDVKIIIDALGSYSFSQLAINRLKANGAEVLLFNSLRLDFSLRKWWSRIWLRNHCKILLIDEEMAFIGGVNIQHHMEEWDDIHLKIKGKVVRQLLRYFARKYIRSGGQKKKVRHLLHPKLTKEIGQWRDKIKFILHSPHYRYKRSPFSKFYRRAIGMAKESFTLLTPYYSPDPRFLELIYRASRRGVKVNILLPYKSDLALMHYLARAFYSISKKAGATFYLLKRMNHGKAVTSDNKLGMIGSANLTPRSFYLNHEANIAFTDEQMVTDLNDILNNWKDNADPLLEMDFNKQAWPKKFKSWLALKLKDLV